MKCISCNTDTSNPKFCSHACSASHTNKTRKRTPWSLEQRLAVKANRVNRTGKKGADNPKFIIQRDMICTVCSKPFTSVRGVRSKRFSCVCSDECFISGKRKCARGTKLIPYKGLKLDSKWELKLAQYLDECGIDWIQPTPITWIDIDNKPHRYYPDFYIPMYDLYLDPKNDFVITLQKEKLDIVSKQINLHYGHVDDLIKMVDRMGVEPT